MSTQKTTFLFDRKNFITILIGFAIVVIGFIMMSGGKADNPNEFHPEEIFSARRITYAPIVVLIGFAVVGFGIMLKPSDDQEDVIDLEDKDKTVIDD
jgi:uncharacterized membrane protein